MALEDIESAGKYISDLVDTNPVGATDLISDGDGHIRGIKNTVTNSLANISGPVTSTHGDLNILSGAAVAGLTAAEIQHVNGVTSAIQTQLDAKAATTDLDDLSGVTDAATARTNLGLGSLATSSAIASTDIVNGGIVNIDIADATLGSEKFQTGGNEDAWVGARTAGLAVGVVGTYAFMETTNGALNIYNPGDTESGSNLDYAGLATFTDNYVNIFAYASTPSGTWRCMGYVGNDTTGATSSGNVTLWLRIS